MKKEERRIEEEEERLKAEEVNRQRIVSLGQQVANLFSDLRESASTLQYEVKENGPVIKSQESTSNPGYSLEFAKEGETLASLTCDMESIQFTMHEIKIGDVNRLGVEFPDNKLNQIEIEGHHVVRDKVLSVVAGTVYNSIHFSIPKEFTKKTKEPYTVKITMDPLFALQEARASNRTEAVAEYVAMRLWEQAGSPK